MNLLGAVLYDPSTAASASTASLLAMTAIDTTNLRIAFTIPAHGKVTVKLSCVTHGGTGVPTLLLGVMDGSTVRGRVGSEKTSDGSVAAAAQVKHKVEFTISGLTPGAVNWDAAYGVEGVSASSAIKYGGPDDTTTNNAFGGFVFEVWDPQPMATAGQLSIDANGRVDVIKVAGTTQTAGDIVAKTAQLTFTTANRVDSSVIDKTGFSLSAAGITAIWAEVMAGTTTAVQAMRGFIAVLLGKASGLPTAPKYRDIADTKDVVSGDTDKYGNRTSVIRDLT